MEKSTNKLIENDNKIKNLVWKDLYILFSDWTRHVEKVKTPTSKQDEKINQKETYREAQLFLDLVNIKQTTDLFNSDTLTEFNGEESRKTELSNKFNRLKQNYFTTWHVLCLSYLHLLVNVKEKWLNKRIDAWDFNQLDDSIYNDIIITKPIRKQDNKVVNGMKDLINIHIGWKNLLKSIRDAIVHKGYIQNSKWIYINYSDCIPAPNSKSKEDLECFISPLFFAKLTKIFDVNRKNTFITSDHENLNFSTGYHANRNKIAFNIYERINKMKWEYEPETKSLAIKSSNFYKNTIKAENIPTSKQKILPYEVFELIDEYFNKFKWNKINFKAIETYLKPQNTIYLCCDFIENFYPIFTKKYENIKGRELTDKYYNDVMIMFKNQIMDLFQTPSIKQEIFSELTNWDNVSNRIILNNTDDIKTTIRQILNKKKFTREAIKKITFSILSARTMLLQREMDWKCVHYGFYNYLKYLFISSWHLNNPDFIPIPIGQTIPEKEHIRNAIAHQNVFMLPWVNKITLWDPTQDKTNLDRSDTYDLDELFKNSYKEFINRYKNSNIKNINIEQYLK